MIMLLSIVLVGKCIAQSTDEEGLLTVSSYDLVSKKHINRAVFEYEYTLSVTNNSAIDAEAQSLVLSTEVSGATLIKDTVNIGPIVASGTVISQDTFIVQVNKRISRFSPLKDISVIFNPQNVEGPDLNDNGVRDDVEEFIAANFAPDSPEHNMAMAMSRMNRASLDPSISLIELRSNISEGGVASVCLKRQIDDFSTFLAELHSKETNTPARIDRYRTLEDRLVDLGSMGLPPAAEIQKTCEQF